MPDVSFEYLPGQNEVRSAQHCFMLCDLMGAADCKAFAFYNLDDNEEGKGNACTFYDPPEPVEAMPLPGFFSGIRGDDWAGPVV